MVDSTPDEFQLQAIPPALMSHGTLVLDETDTGA